MCLVPSQQPNGVDYVTGGETEAPDSDFQGCFYHIIHTCLNPLGSCKTKFLSLRISWGRLSLGIVILCSSTVLLRRWSVESCTKTWGLAFCTSTGFSISEKRWAAGEKRVGRNTAGASSLVCEWVNHRMNGCVKELEWAAGRKRPGIQVSHSSPCRGVRAQDFKFIARLSRSLAKTAHAPDFKDGAGRPFAPKSQNRPTEKKYQQGPHTDPKQHSLLLITKRQTRHSKHRLHARRSYFKVRCLRGGFWTRWSQRWHWGRGGVRLWGTGSSQSRSSSSVWKITSARSFCLWAQAKTPRSRSLPGTPCSILEFPTATFQKQIDLYI